MIPDQTPPKAKTLELGKVYICVRDNDSYIFTATKCSCIYPQFRYYGPIDTTPSAIDLSHFDLSKIEAKKQPDKPGVWHLSKSTNGFPDADVFISQELFDHPSDWDDGEYRFLCDLIPPKQSPVIPPKPENVLHLMRLTKKELDCDGEVSDVHWCIKDKGGDFRVLSDGRLTGISWLKRQCEPVTE